MFIRRINELRKSGLTLVDMHSHTVISDGFQSPVDCFNFAKKNNFGLCITDHDEVYGNSFANNKVFNIPSTEVTSSECIDLLFYFRSYNDSLFFYNKYIKNNKLRERPFLFRKLSLSSHELIDYAKNFNAVIAIPHPHTVRPKNSFLFFTKNKENRELLKRCDAIEGINSAISKPRNIKAVNWAFELNKPLIASSDAHEMKYLGSALTAAYASNQEDFLEAVIKNKTMIVAKPLSPINRMITGMKILYNNIKII